MASVTSTRSGCLHSLRTLGDGFLGILHERVELLSVELHEEKYRLIQTFAWISAAIFTAMMAVAFASLTLVYAFWASARLTVLGGLTLFYAAALVGVIVAFRRHLAREPRPFAGTLQEMKADRAALRDSA